jgi:hypothetical protein
MTYSVKAICKLEVHSHQLKQLNPAAASTAKSAAACPAAEVLHPAPSGQLHHGIHISFVRSRLGNKTIPTHRSGVQQHRS